MALTSAKSACFLIVDRDPAYAADLARLLRPRGDAVAVGTIKEAIAAFPLRPAWTALIVGDPLPDGSGLDVVEALAKLSEHTPALVLASDMDPLASHRAYALGAWLVIKPVEPALVLLFVARALAVRPTYEEALVEVLREWDTRYRLAPAQSVLLARMARHATRAEVALLRRVKPGTVKKDITRLLAKTEHPSMPALLQSLHGEVIARMEGRPVDEPMASETRIRAVAPLSAVEVTKARRSR